MLSLSSILRVVPGIASAPVAGETTVLDPRTGLYFGLEDAAAHIWGLLAGPIAVRDVVAALHAEYDVTEEECFADVVAFAEELIERGLVEVLPAPRPA